MPTRVRRLLSSCPRDRLWRAPIIGLLLTGILLGYSTLLPIWAQATAPRLLISEVHPAAKAVEDKLGEWIELYNPGSEAVNLQFWSIINQGNAEHLFPFELWIPAGGYVVLTNFADPAQNGGVQPTYVYTSFSLGNASEQLSLRDPEGEIVDSVAWGEGTTLSVISGASFERSAPQANAPWVMAHSPWPGSAGDLGSPGAPYSPPPTATPTVTPPPAIPPRLLLSEIMANPNAVSDELGEWT